MERLGATHPARLPLIANRPRRRGISLAAFAAVLALVAAGCGSSDPEPTGDATSGEAVTDDQAPADAESGDTAEAPAEGSGDQTGTVTTDDGTVYELVVGSCETSDTHPNALPLDHGFDLSGRTADEAFRFGATRAGFDNESSVFSGSLEGDFDDEGKNAKMLYSIDRDTLDATVDGANVTGSFTMGAIAPTRPHGDEIGATFEFNC